METSAVNGPSWMTDASGRLGPRAIRAIAMPAAHDAGMSTLTSWTMGSKTCNTVTQSGDILAQLNCGARYFDLRPVAWAGDGFFLGHFSKLPYVEGKYVGGTGQPLAERCSKSPTSCGNLGRPRKSSSSNSATS